MRPLVLHLDIDAFFASVEQLRNPRIAGRPVAVGSGVIASCSYEARERGLSAGMPLRRAERLCPELVVVEGHQAIYRAYAERTFELCRRWAPEVESHLDEAYCDLSGTGRIYPEPLEVGRRLKEGIHGELGLRVTIGLGRNRMFARLATRRAKPDGLKRVAPEREEALLLSLPTGELPGVGPKTTRILERLNIHTVADLRRLPARALEALLGRPGRAIYERCRGEDHRAIGALEVPRSIRRETTFHDDTDDPREIDGMLHYLLERASRTLRQRGLETGGIAVHIVYADFARDERRRRLPAPTALDPLLIENAFALRRELYQRRVALRHLGVTLDRLRLAPEATQGLLFEEAVEGGGAPALTPMQRERWKRLLTGVDRIRDRYGYASLVTGRSLHLLAPTREGGQKLARDAHGFILRTPCLTK
ncbi:MAG: DNA polymerase IV [Planctomycetota bacterium]